MSDKILQKYTSRGGGGEPDVALIESAEAEDLGSFGWLRGHRDRAITVELRKKTGHIIAVSYAFISKFEYEPSLGIVLHCGGQLYTIKGRNLNQDVRPNVRLFEGLARMRVPWIQEADRSESLKPDRPAVTIETISW
jgi:hypothetical protein